MRDEARALCREKRGPGRRVDHPSGGHDDDEAPGWTDVSTARASATATKGEQYSTLAPI
jgi:hypothetical protein